MDCSTARLLLDFARPSSKELEASEAEALQNHLHDCTECAALAQSERARDEVLGRAMRAVQVPQGLQTRLMKRLDKKRDAWYLRRVGKGLMAAAVLGLAVGVWGVWRNSRPELDLALIHQEAQSQASLASPKDVEQWYRDRGVTVVAPTQFDYRWFVSPNFGKLPGSDVQAPMLLFIRDKDVYAQVFIVSRQFNLKKFEANDQISPYYQGVYWVRCAPPNENFAFVILCPGSPGNLDKLLKSAAAQ
jgi:hypothetical protein